MRRQKCWKEFMTDAGDSIRIPLRPAANMSLRNHFIDTAEMINEQFTTFGLS